MNPAFEIVWDEETSLSRDWGHLRISIDGKWVWTHRNGPLRDGGPAKPPEVPGIHWTWGELLDHLTGAWPDLARSGWPTGLPRDTTPSTYRAHSRVLIATRPGGENDLFDFRNAHDLSFGVHGKLVPSLLIVRQGDDCWIGNSKVEARLPWVDVHRFLSLLGDTIAERLGPGDLAEVWKAREPTP